MPGELENLYASFDDCVRCRAEKNPLRHILGGGLTDRPTFLFLFINPTHHNRSSHADYPGERRYPFIGVRYFWKVMSAAGVVDASIVDDVYARGWHVEHEHSIERELKRRKIYVTNLVKCTQPHGDNPSRDVIAADLPLVRREIAIVRPRFIVPFGIMPTRALTGRDVRLSDQLLSARSGTYEPLVMENDGRHYPVLPCYFPVGRGNPPKAIELLGYILNRFRS